MAKNIVVTDEYGTAAAAPELANLKVAQLRVLAQQLGIRGYLKLKKAELVQALEEHQRGGAVAAPAEPKAETPAAEKVEESKPRRTRRTRAQKDAEAKVEKTENTEAAEAPAEGAEKAEKSEKRTRSSRHETPAQKRARARRAAEGEDASAEKSEKTENNEKPEKRTRRTRTRKEEKPAELPPLDVRAELAAERIGERAEQVDLPGNSAELKAATADGSVTARRSVQSAMLSVANVPSVRLLSVQNAQSVPSALSAVPSVTARLSVLRSRLAAARRTSLV